MYYHCSIFFSQGYHCFYNSTKEKLIASVLGPFMLGQKIKCTRSRPDGVSRNAILNLESSNYLIIFKSEDKLSDEESKKFRKTGILGNDCTEEILNEIRFDFASDNVKSLMEKLIFPPLKQIFVIMKFDDELLDSVFKGVIRLLGEELGYTVTRIDDIQDSGNISEQILEKIAESEIVIADLTGNRPNCYFETGVALATGRDLVLTINESDKPHFDLVTNRFIIWKTEHELRTKLRERLESIITDNE